MYLSCVQKHHLVFPVLYSKKMFMTFIFSLTSSQAFGSVGLSVSPTLQAEISQQLLDGLLC